MASPAPFSRYEFLIAWRYLRAKRAEGGVSVMTWISLIGIMLAVAALIITLAVLVCAPLPALAGKRLKVPPKAIATAPSHTSQREANFSSKSANFCFQSFEVKSVVVPNMDAYLAPRAKT